jgi:hypothetical protein
MQPIRNERASGRRDWAWARAACLAAALALAACAPVAGRGDPAGGRSLSSAELAEGTAWDLFKLDTYWLTALTVSAWECDDCDFTEDGTLKECRGCRPVPYERVREARRQAQPPETPRSDDDASGLRSDGDLRRTILLRRIGAR